MCNIFGRMLFVLCLSVPCLWISLSPPTSEGPGHQEGPSQSLPPCPPIPCSCLPPRPLPAGPSVLCGQDVLFSLPLSQLQGQSAMAKEKTVAIPRGTVLAYRVLQLVMGEDRWGTRRLEEPEQLGRDSPSGRAGRGAGAASKCGAGSGRGRPFPRWPEQAASQADTERVCLSQRAAEAPALREGLRASLCPACPGAPGMGGCDRRKGRLT